MSRRVVFHISFWIAYVLFKTYLNFGSPSSQIDGKQGYELFFLVLSGQLIFLLVKVPYVYLCFFIIDKYLTKSWLFAKALVVTIIVSVIISILGLILNNLVVLKYVYNIQYDIRSAFSYGSIIYSFFICAFPCGIAIAIKLIRLNIRQKELNQELLKNKLESEINLLKAQLNPHFLFNTLNNIYGLALRKSDETAPIVSKLAQLMRFMLYESERKSIPIASEIKIIEDYIELESLRYNDKLDVTMVKVIDDESIEITPLLFLPLIENAFKHGSSESRSNSFININFHLKKKQLNFSVINSYEEGIDVNNKEGIGLTNIKRQLSLLYKEYVFNAKKHADYFEVSLFINLNSNAI